jgi:hypothetical protein
MRRSMTIILFAIALLLVLAATAIADESAAAGAPASLPSELRSFAPTKLPAGKGKLSADHRTATALLPRAPQARRRLPAQRTEASISRERFHDLKL